MSPKLLIETFRYFFIMMKLEGILRYQTKKRDAFMSEETRRCKVLSRHDKPEGTFIKFAPVRFYDEGNNPYAAEQAIVELDNGKVLSVNPDEIHFIK